MSCGGVLRASPSRQVEDQLCRLPRASVEAVWELSSGYKVDFGSNGHCPGALLNPQGKSKGGASGKSGEGTEGPVLWSQSIEELAMAGQLCSRCGIACTLTNGGGPFGWGSQELDFSLSRHSCLHWRLVCLRSRPQVCRESAHGSNNLCGFSFGGELLFLGCRSHPQGPALLTVSAPTGHVSQPPAQL